MVANVNVEVLYQASNQVGEAATWLEREKVFLWVDITGCEMYEYDPEKKSTEKHHFDNMVSTIIPTQTPYVVIIAQKDRLLTYHLQSHQKETLMLLDGNMTDLRTNDGKASPDGRIWIGVMHLTNHNQTGALYCIDKDLKTRKVLDKQCIPNGIVWNKAGTKMYYADSGRGCIEEYDYNMQTGYVKFIKIAVQVPPSLGVPDGMTIDNNDMLWVAHWGGFGVYCWNPQTGQLLDKITLPVPNVASCTFGGYAKDQLYITTACSGLNTQELNKYPLSGSLFSVKTTKVGGQNHYQFIHN